MLTPPFLLRQERLEDVESYLSEQVQDDEFERQNVRTRRTVLEAVIQSRHAKLTATIDRLRDDQLTALNDVCCKIDADLASDVAKKQDNCRQVRQLIRQVDETLSSNKAIQLLTVAKEMREGRGSENEVKKLRTAKRTQVTRPALTLKKSDAIMKECVREAMTLTIESVKKEVEVPEVAVKKQFQCCHETDVRIFSLCPTDNNAVTVSYEMRGGKENAPSEYFDWSGKFLRRGVTRKKFTGKSTRQARGYGQCLMVEYNNGDSTLTFSKSPRETPIKLKYSTSLSKGFVTSYKVLSEDPYKEEPKTLCSLAMPGPQRAFDVDASQKYVAVLQDFPRRVMLYKLDQPDPVDTYTPPSPRCRPSDICFFRLRKKHVLLVADEGTDSIHVLRVQDQTLIFQEYLAPGWPLLVQPTALNTDHTGQLWVACKDGVIITMRPVTQ
jgi:hypothetical protein